jgi:hypothetical protein
VNQRASRPSPSRRPLLFGAGALVLVGAALGVKLWADQRAAVAARSAALAAVDAALAVQPANGDELSRCMTALKALPDHEQAHDLLAAQARVELARERADRAEQLFGAIATQPGATPAEMGLGARILLRRHEAGYADAVTAAGVLQQVVPMAEASYRDRGDPTDLLRAWQAAERLGDRAKAKEFAERLAQQHAGTPAAAFVTLANNFDPQQGTAALDRVAADFVDPPVELAALRAFALLQVADLTGAVQVVEAALLRAPGVTVVRWAAAVTFHACAVGCAEGSPERERWVVRRDPQLDQVAASGAFGEARRAQCEQMRALR